MVSICQSISLFNTILNLSPCFLAIYCHWCGRWFIHKKRPCTIRFTGCKFTDKYIIFTRGQFWPSGIVVACVCLSMCVSVCVCVRQPRACPRHKSSHLQARITKFGQKVQKNLVKVPIVFGGNGHWPSRSNLTWKAKFTPFWACPCHNSPFNQARTIKFGQKM